MTERARGYRLDRGRPVTFPPPRVEQVTGRQGNGGAAPGGASQGALLCLLVRGLAAAVATPPRSWAATT
jgi:hypothetical protein